MEKRSKMSNLFCTSSLPKANSFHRCFVKTLTFLNNIKKFLIEYLFLCYIFLVVVVGGFFRPSDAWHSISQMDPRRAAATAGWETRSPAAPRAPPRPFHSASPRRSTTSKHHPTVAPREMETPTPNQVSAEPLLCSDCRETSPFIFVIGFVFTEFLRLSWMETQ